jgi:hypothetical protein
MEPRSINPDSGLLNAQNPHWENAFSKRADMFGTETTIPAEKALAQFKKKA